MRRNKGRLFSLSLSNGFARHEFDGNVDADREPETALKLPDDGLGGGLGEEIHMRLDRGERDNGHLRVEVMPLMQGILSGKYDTIESIPLLRRRTLHFDSANNDQIRHGGRGMEPQLQAFLTELKAFSAECGIRCSELAIGWILSNPQITTVLAGCRTRRQLQENVAAIETKLTDDVVQRLNEISAPIANLCGANCDLWQWNSRIW